MASEASRHSHSPHRVGRRLAQLTFVAAVILRAEGLWAYGTNQPAEVVVGQANFSGDLSNRGVSPAQANTLHTPIAAVTDGARLLISDVGNNRVLLYNTLPSTHNASADVVIGQADFTSSSANQGGSTGANTLNVPYGLFLDGMRLFVADEQNNRVLIYNTLPSAPNAAADVVIGQPNLSSSTANQNGIASANTLFRPRAVFLKDSRLYVADTLNHRVLIYNTVPSTHNASADIVVGQATFAGNSQNQGAGNPNAQSFSLPDDVFVTADDHLIITSENGHRTLIYNVLPSTHNATANVVVGQVDFLQFNSNQGASPNANTLSTPAAVFSDGEKFFIADRGNNRVLIFDSLPSAGNVSANWVIGQQNFTAVSDNQGVGPSATAIEGPVAVKGGGGWLVVAEQFNHRVMLYRAGQFSLTNVSPTAAYGSTAVSLTVTGGEFLPGSSLILRRSGQSDITATAVGLSSITVTGTFNLAGQTAGLWDVVVASGSLTATASGGFELRTFSITQAIPNFSTNSGSLQVFVTGQNFPDGSTVKMTRTGKSDINGQNVTVSSTVISATFNVHKQSAGLWNVVVSSGLAADTYTNSFLISNAGNSNFSTEEQARGAIGPAGGSLNVATSSLGLTGAQVLFPAGALPANLSLDITLSAVLNPPDAPAALQRIGRTADLEPSGLTFNQPVTLRLPYTEADLNQVPDRDPNNLSVATFDLNTFEWQTIAPVTVDTGLRLVSVGISHFSLYSLAASAVLGFDAVSVYPSPFRPAQGHSAVTFSNLPDGAHVRIYTSSGELIRSLNNGANSSQLQWDGMNEAGHSVAGGVYFYLLQNGTETKKGKLAVIR